LVLGPFLAFPRIEIYQAISRLHAVPHTKPTSAAVSLPLVIAIDGPSKSGKGTCALELAKHYGFHHVDTGAMYRLLTLHCLRTGVDIAKPEAVLAACLSWKTELKALDHEIRLTLNGEFPEKEIRGEAVSENVAKVSPMPAVRIWMARQQRECLRFGSLVVDGRDVGTVVFPETPFKFFLTADESLREKRSVRKGEVANMKDRDRRDSTRKSAPLVQAPDAVLIDNTHDHPEITVAFMKAHIDFKRRQLGL
jgi:cytidylate kinase